MPAPTPAQEVLAAARVFAREKFAVRHRYALVLHTDQANPHVHLVVKAEDIHGKRLHIGKPMLREWREDFARTMRDQGIAANATPRVVRGRNKGKRHDGVGGDVNPRNFGVERRIVCERGRIAGGEGGGGYR